MKLEFIPFHLKLNHVWAISSSANVGGGKEYAPTVIVRLKDKSTVGLGEAPTSQRYVQNVDSIQNFLRLVEPERLSFDDIPCSMAYIESLGPNNYSAKCAINVALLDGAARRAGQPIYRHLGLGFTEKKHLTSYSIGIATPEKIRRKTAEAAAYPILKLKIGSPSDRENLAALREVDPTKTVRVDANEGWTTKEEAVRNLEWLAQDPHIEYVEQPMPAGTAWSDLAWVKARSPLPLYGDESCQHASDVPKCAEAYHGVNVKLIKTGGITGAYEALQAARKAGLKTMIGCMIETSVLITAAAHLAELTDHLDIDGNLLTTNDPYLGATAEKGVISFANTPEKIGLCVNPRAADPFPQFRAKRRDALIFTRTIGSGTRRAGKNAEAHLRLLVDNDSANYRSINIAFASAVHNDAPGSSAATPFMTTKIKSAKALAARAARHPQPRTPPFQVILTYKSIQLGSDPQDSLGFIESREFADENAQNALQKDISRERRDVTWLCKFPFLLIFDSSDCNLLFALTPGGGTAYFYLNPQDPASWVGLESTLVADGNGDYKIALHPTKYNTGHTENLTYVIYPLCKPSAGKGRRKESSAIVRATITTAS